MTNTVTTTVLFTDLVGSTELAARLGPTKAEETRNLYFGLLRGALETHGGTEIKNLGDGLMVVYPSLSDALASAVAMQQALDRHNRSSAEALLVRIGLSTGDATEDDGDYFGEPVVEAARLCQGADGGQIVTTAIVQLQARRTDHAFKPLGTVTLKGLPEPIDTVEVLWEPLKELSKVVLPSRLTREPSAGLVGREVERETMRAALKRVTAGEGRGIVLLGGEPGIGKTTLAADLAREAREHGATVLFGRCDEEVGVPYQPFVEAVRDFVAAAPEAVIAALDPIRLGELSRLVPEVRQRGPAASEPAHTDPDAERYLLFGAVTGALTDLAARAPVVLVLDDLHWADRSTVLLLRHLALSLLDAAVLIVGTYRDTDLTTGHPMTELLASLRREPRIDRIAVKGLDDLGVVALVEGLAGHDLQADGIALAHAVRRETDGNPFFTEEIILHLAESGAVRFEGSRWVAAVDLATIDLPESVREAVGQRVRFLDEPTQQLLTVASVIGRDFDVPLLAAAADADEDDVVDRLDGAVTAGVLHELGPNRYTFTHALFQHTLYDGLGANRRSRLHRRIGEVIEAQCGPDPGDRIGELAHHWAAAVRPSDTAKAATYATRAGERALAARAPHEAERWFRNALELLDGEGGGDPRLRLDVIIGLGDAQRQSGDPVFRETLLAAADAAQELGDDDRLIAATLTNLRGAVSRVGTVDEERVAGLERALGAVGPEPSSRRAELLATMAAELTFCGDIERIRALAGEAEAIARSLGNDHLLLKVLNLCFIPLWVPDALEANLARTAEAEALARDTSDLVAAFWASQNRLCALASHGDFATVGAALDRSMALADQIGQPYLRWQVTYNVSWFRLMKGDVEGAEDLANKALEIGSNSGQPDAFTMFGANLVAVRWHQGRLEEVVPLIAQAGADNPGLPSFQAAHALFLCESGKAQDAHPLLDAAQARDFDRSVYDYTWLTTSSAWGETAAWLGDVDAAATLFDQLQPFEAQCVVNGATFTGTVGMVLARLAATLGRRDQAQTLFARADAQLRAFDCPFLRARNQVEWARLLLDDFGTQADRHFARTLLVDAEATAAGHGCAAVRARAGGLLATLD